jgi:hypothetical protein
MPIDQNGFEPHMTGITGDFSDLYNSGKYLKASTIDIRSPSSISAEDFIKKWTPIDPLESAAFVADLTELLGN